MFIGATVLPCIVLHHQWLLIVFAADMYTDPNKGNGLDLDSYSWGQSLQEVSLNIPVPPGTKSRFIVCDIKKNHLTVGLKGQPPIIDVSEFSCFWPFRNIFCCSPFENVRDFV